MMTNRKLICILLAICLLQGAPAVAAEGGRHQGESAVKEQIGQLPAGTVVVVRLRNDQRLQCRLEEVSEHGFRVRSVAGTDIEPRLVGYDQVKSVKPLKKQPGKEALQKIGAAGALLLLFGLTVWAEAQ